jgi:hypothetical protein
MSTYQIPHVNDLTTNAKLPGQLAENMQAINYALNDIDARLNEVSDQVKQLQEGLKQLMTVDINTEYITDTDINTDNTIDAPTSIMVNDGGNGDELSGLTIEEQKGEN